MRWLRRGAATVAVPLAVLTGCTKDLPTLEVTPGVLQLAVGRSASMEAVWTDGAEVDVTGDAAWSSTDPNVADVDGDGQVLVLGEGLAEIVAEYEGVTASADLTATPAVVDVVDLQPDSVSLAVGQGQQLTVELTWSDGEERIGDCGLMVTPPYAEQYIHLDGDRVVADGLNEDGTHPPLQVEAQCGEAFDLTDVTVRAAEVVSIAFDTPDPAVALGETFLATTTLTWSDDTVSAGTGLVTYSSEDPDIAEADAFEEGLYITRGVGSAVLQATVTSNPLITTTTVLSVGPIEPRSVEVSPDPLVVPVGLVGAYTATGVWTDGSRTDETSACNWSTPAGIGVYGAPGLYKAVKVGVGTVSATCFDDALVDTAAFEATDAILLALDLVPDTFDLRGGDVAAYSVFATLSDGQVLDVTASAAVAVTGPISATPGLLSADDLGVGELTVSYGGFEDRSPVTVADWVTTVTVDPPELLVDLGTFGDLTATADWWSGLSEDVTATATWTSDLEFVATVSAGLVEGLAGGETTIRALYEGAEGSSLVTVRALTGVKIEPNLATLLVDGSATMVAKAQYSDGFMVDVTQDAVWTTADETVATIDLGAVTGLAPGFVQVTADWNGYTDTAYAKVSWPQFESSPAAGEGDVAVTRETILTFTSPLDPSVTVTDADVFATFGGETLPVLLHTSPDRRTVTLFYDAPLPGSSTVTVTVNGDALLTESGYALDADKDGVPGGTAEFDFTTLSLTPVDGTSVSGRIFASALSPVYGDPGVNVPLAGVTITVDGIDPSVVSAVTDADGNFRLEPVPIGDFFVHVDGRTSPPEEDEPGAYYPSVGKPWHSNPGVDTDVGTVYLPEIPAGTLQAVSATEDTTIYMADEVLAEHPEYADVRVTVPADALYADDGTRGGSVGIAPVPADRLPGQLPDFLDFPIVITVQTDGATNFDVPVPACFPNLPHPETGEVLAPGEKSGLYSFNHDTGRFEPMGPMTVAASGALICTDPGVGIQAPGWHGVAQVVSLTILGAYANGGGNSCDPSSASLRPNSGVSSGASCCDPEVNNTQRLQCLSNARKKQLARLAECKYPTFLMTDLLPVDITDPCAISDFGASHFYWDLVPTYRYGLRACERAQDDMSCERQAEETNQTAIVDCAERYPKCPGLEASFTPQAQSELEQIATDALTVASRRVELDDEITALVPDPATPYGSIAAHILPLIDPLTLEYFEVVEFRDPGLWYLTKLVEMSEVEVVDFSINPGAVDVLPIARPVYYKVYEGDGVDFSQRGMSTPLGALPALVLKPETSYTVALYDPLTGASAWGGLMTPSAGLSTLAPPLIMDQVLTEDEDADGLSHEGEFVVGTGASVPDTDSDGVSDGAELAAGTDPLDGLIVTTGIIGSADTPGTALDACALDDLLALADSAGGVSLFNIFNAMEPLTLARVPTGGAATRVACGEGYVAVVEQGVGLTFLDVSQLPAAPVLSTTALIRPTAVAAAGPIAYAGTDEGLVFAIDVATGAILGSVPLGAPVEDLGVGADNTLYALTVGTLHAIRTKGPLAVLGSAPSPGIKGVGQRPLRLFVGSETAYATHTQGYNVLSLSDPSHPALVKENVTTQFGWKQIVDNGAGVGIATVGPNSTDDGVHNVSMYDLSAPLAAPDFVTEYSTPGLATAAIIYNGLAYVADSDSGLQVVNYLAYDALGLAPTIDISGEFTDGVVEEGKSITVVAEVTDDVQVRNVEFWIDGEKVLTDGSYPFVFRFTTPLLAEQATVLIEARAVDTGGNATWSLSYDTTLVPDETPPNLTSQFPGPNYWVHDLAVISAWFDEPIAEATVTGASFFLTSAGADGVLGTSDDSPVAGVHTTNDELAAAFLDLGSTLPAGDYEVTVTTALTDLAGNPLVTGAAWSFHTFAPVLGDSDGDCLPDDIEVAMGTDPLLTDSDGDGVPDGQGDFDFDGLVDCEDIQVGASPLSADTDGDGLLDPTELLLLTGPSVVDTDADGINDGEELLFGTDPVDANSHPAFSLELTTGAAWSLGAIAQNVADGRSNAFDVQAVADIYGVDAEGVDTDGDGLSDALELAAGTDPALVDGDADGFTDLAELDAAFFYGAAGSQGAILRNDGDPTVELTAGAAAISNSIENQ